MDSAQCAQTPDVEERDHTLPAIGDLLISSNETDRDNVTRRRYTAPDTAPS